VEENYENTKDLEATFIQESHIKTMDTVEKSEGKLYIKKPGKMRWDYKRPKRQEILIEGKTIWIYNPDEKHVIKSPLSDPKSGFLSGVGRLRDEFEISLSKVSGGYLLRLIPKAQKGTIETILLEILPTDYTIQRFSLIDIYGNKTTITLKDIKINKGLSDSIFHFKVPKGVKVIEG